MKKCWRCPNLGEAGGGRGLGAMELSFIDYTMDEKPKYPVEECKARTPPMPPR